MDKEKIILQKLDIPVDGSLGLLAFGDIAFTKWRKIKKDSRQKDEEKK